MKRRKEVNISQGTIVPNTFNVLARGGVQAEEFLGVLKTSEIDVRL